MACKIFISYREEDRPQLARELYNVLRESFQDDVFLASAHEFGLQPGDEVLRGLLERVQECTVLIAVIGPEWEALATARAKSGGGEDYLIAEIREALKPGTRVVPVLVDGAKMPRHLPQAIIKLKDRHAKALHTARFQESCRALRADLERELNTLPYRVRLWRRAAIGLAGILLMLVIGGALWWEHRPPRSLVIESPTHLHGIRLLGTGEEGQSTDGLRFTFKTTLDADKLAVYITRRGDAEPPRIPRPEIRRAVAARESDNHYRLPADPWSDARFVGLANAKNVAVLLPCVSDSCNSLAGQSLYRGAAVFQNTASPYSPGVALALRTYEIPQAITGLPGKPGNPTRQPASALIDALAEEGDPIVAGVGAYHSVITHEVISACQTGSPWSRCGPLVTLSSATSIRERFPRPSVAAQTVPWHEPTDQPWVFRISPDNVARARALAHMLSTDAQSFKELQIVYQDDRVAGHEPEWNYLFDLLLQLEAAIRDDDHLRNEYIYRVSYKKDGQKLAVMERGPALRGRTLPAVRTFSDLARHLLDRTRGRERAIVLLALDDDIVDFGCALSAVGTNHLRGYYVTGPRDSLEYKEHPQHTPCPYLKRFEELGLRLITVDDNNASMPALRLRTLWSRSEWPDAPLTSQASQIYDALSIVGRAVQAANARLSALAEEDHAWVEVDLYRNMLRDEIAAIKHQGASGLIMFDEDGNAVSPMYVMELRGGELRPLDPTRLGH